MTLSPLVALLTAANLTNFNGAKHYTDHLTAVRMDIPRGRWFTAKDTTNITFPFLDANSTVIVTPSSLQDAFTMVNVSNSTFNFAMEFFVVRNYPHWCTPYIDRTSTIDTRYEYYFDNEPMRTLNLTGNNPQISTHLNMKSVYSNLTDIVFRPVYGCFEYVGMRCGLDSSEDDTLKIAFSREEFANLNPSSGIGVCSTAVGESSNLSSIWENKDNANNVAIKISTKLWEDSSVQDDAVMFYRFEPKTKSPTTSPANQVVAIFSILVAILLTCL